MKTGSKLVGYGASQQSLSRIMAEIPFESPSLYRGEEGINERFPRRKSNKSSGPESQLFCTSISWHHDKL
jgi:hypothetical protein